MNQLFRTKSIDALIAASEEPDKRLRKTLGPWSLTALGVGAVIGSGIFMLTGTAAAGKVEKINSVLNATVLDLLTNGLHAGSTMGRPGAGPAISLSFLLVAIACCFAGVCYAELASMIPIAGSAYTYSYAILGEICGLDHRLGPDSGIRRLATWPSRWDSPPTSQDLLDNLFGFHLPAAIAYPRSPRRASPAALFNVPALVIMMIVTVDPGARRAGERRRQHDHGADQDRGHRDLRASARSARSTPRTGIRLCRNGFSGVLTGASIVFFTYIGFDSVSTAAEECRKPQRDLPIGIIATLIVCTILYGSVSLVLTGIMPYTKLGNDSPVADALKALSYNRLRLV